MITAKPENTGNWWNIYRIWQTIKEEPVKVPTKQNLCQQIMLEVCTPILATHYPWLILYHLKIAILFIIHDLVQDQSHFFTCNFKRNDCNVLVVLFLALASNILYIHYILEIVFLYFKLKLTAEIPTFFKKGKE